MRSVSWDDVAALEAEIAQRIPGFKVCYKDESRLQRVIGVILRPFNGAYMTRYTTVMFRRVYFPSRSLCQTLGPTAIYKTLRHEAVHLDDMRRFPLFFQLSYLFLLPAGLTFRAWWEWRAYAETLRVEAELTGEIPDALIEHIAERFTGADYLFMFPFPGFIRRKLRSLRRQILSSESQAETRS